MKAIRTGAKPSTLDALEWVDIDAIAPVMVYSVMMSEDGQFCRHDGIDWGEMRAVVKFFNDIRGYGFVTAKDLNEDVFVYSQVLNYCEFHSLMKEQKL